MQQQLQQLQRLTPLPCRTHHQHVPALRPLALQWHHTLQQRWRMAAASSSHQQLYIEQTAQQQLHSYQRQPCRSNLSSNHAYSTICRSTPASASAAFGGNSSSDSNSSPGNSAFAAAIQLAGQLQDTARDFKDVVLKFAGLWRSFLPMLSLFFCLSFVNTMLDSLKDTLVITAHGGGAFVIPYLTVYAVLPISVVFLFLFSAASHWMTRAALFNTIILVFMAFFGGFALFMYPNVDVLHPHAFADKLQQVLPHGLAGFVGMLRNWTFTLFFCMSELWGDVCMGLLFWGLANEITSLSDAATLYPLFGLGANIAQALAGVVLKATTCGGARQFGQALQMSMAAVIGIAGFAILLQQKITNDAAAAAAKRRRHRRHNSANPPGHLSSSSSITDVDTAAAAAAEAEATAADAAAEAEWQQQQIQKRKDKAAAQPSAWESIKVLGNSLEIRCLAVMSLAQGLCNSLMEFAWKCHMRILYPSPADFTAFLGDVATWSGVVTGGLMLLTPLLFERWGWRGVANATPNIFLFGGTAFFIACIAYQHLFGAAVMAGGAAAAGPVGVALLQGLVMSGALLYVFGKGAKFSLFKPAEEMVYITLDEDGRTRGKAAIDVVGAQTGKSGGSLLQQVLLLISAGSITGIMPVMFGVFFLMLRGWRSAVHDLSQVRHYSYDSPTASMDEDEDDAGSDAGRLSPGVQLQVQQKLQDLGSAAAAAGADVPLYNVDAIGTKSYQSAVARTTRRASSSSNASSSSSGSAAALNGESGVATDSLVAANGYHARPGRGGKILLSEEAAAAFTGSFAAADDGGPVPGGNTSGSSSSSSNTDNASSSECTSHSNSSSSV